MTTISGGGTGAVTYLPSGSEQSSGRVKTIDLKQFSVLSAASDMAFVAADTDKNASLSRDEFAALGKNSSSDTETQALFAALDADKDGALNSQEVRASGLLSPSNIQTLLGVNDLGAFMVSAADGDGNGALSYEEYVESRGAGPITIRMQGSDGKTTEGTAYRLDAAPQIFKQMDEDGDGQLSASELNAHLVADEGMASYAPSPDLVGAVQALVSYGDSDGDDMLSAEEIASAATAAGISDAETADLVASADSDGDGKVGSDEFAALASTANRSILGFVHPEGEDASASDLMLEQLLHSAYARLTESFLGEDAPSGQA